MKIAKIKNYIKPEYIFIVVLLSIALIRFNVGSLRTLMIFYFRFSITMLIAFYLIKNINLWAGLLLMLMAVAYFYRILHVIPSKTIIEPIKVYYVNQAYLAIDCTILGLIWYSGIVVYCSKTEHLLSVLFGIALLHCLFIFMKFYGVAPYYFFSGGKWMVHNARPLGITANTNEASALLAILIAIFLRPKYIWFALIPIIALLPVKSMNGVLGVSMAMMVYSFLSFKNIWLKSLSILIPIGLFFVFYKYIDYNHENIFIRIETWKSAKKFFENTNGSYFIGSGNWLAIYPFLVKKGEFANGWIRLHNTYIQGIVEMGFGFVIILLGYLADILRRYLKSNLKHEIIPLIAGLAGIAAVCGANSMFRMNYMNAIFAVTMLAMLERKLRQGETIAQ